MRMTAGSIAVVLSTLSQAPGPQTQHYIFATIAAHYVIESNGMSSVEVWTNHTRLRTTDYPFAMVTTASGSIPASTVVLNGATLTATFGSTGIQADFVITSRPDYFVVEVSAVRGGPIDQLCFAQMRPTQLMTAGELLAVRWSDDFSISLMSLNEELESRLGPDQTIVACASRTFATIVGQRVAVLAAPTGQYLDTIRLVERDYSLPSPAIAGEWAKRSEDARTSYLFVDMDEANVDEVIRYAKLGHFGYILVYSSTWSSSLGSYPINTTHYPSGQEGLRRVIERCHRAGIKVGMHMLTSLIDKQDPLAHSVPLSGLLHDTETKLAAPIDESATVVNTTALPPAQPSETLDTSGSDMQIENEIVHCNLVTGNLFGECVRGFGGTKRAPHQIGAGVYHLVVREGAYLADLKGPLKEIIATRVAKLINESGFDMIYFDGGELNAANGPSWYWAGVQQESIWKRVRRELLVQGSGWTQWSWHFFTRGTCDDFAAIGTRPYLDHYKIAYVRELHRRNFMPAELGWVGYAQNASSHPPTLPEDLEQLAVRMLALDTAAGIETTLQDLRGNGRTEETLRLFGQYEDLRLARRMPKTSRRQLERGNWHLMSNAGAHSKIERIERTVTWTDVTAEEVTTLNTFDRESLRFRAEIAPIVGAAGEPANLPLLRRSVVLKRPNATTPMPGALAEQIDLVTARRPLDLRHHRTLAVTVRVVGYQPTEPISIINIQLQNGINYRDHYVDLDFNGEKTIVVREPEVERMLGDLLPDNRNYPFKAALRDFSYEAVSSVNLRWMRIRSTAAIQCSINRIEAIAEVDAPVTGFAIGIGSKEIAVPARLTTGSYVESSGDGFIRWFDQSGRTLGTADFSSVLLNLDRGKNVLTVRTSQRGAIKTTVWTSGDQIEIMQGSGKR